MFSRLFSCAEVSRSALLSLVPELDKKQHQQQTYTMCVRNNIKTKKQKNIKQKQKTKTKTPPPPPRAPKNHIPLCQVAKEDEQMFSSVPEQAAQAGTEKVERERKIQVDR